VREKSVGKGEGGGGRQVGRGGGGRLRWSSTSGATRPR
jgi:hypothetical protein